MKQIKPYIVFIDLDKTLLTINSGKELVLSAYKKGLMSSFDLAKAIILSILFKFKLKNTQKITELMAKWLKGIPEVELKNLAEQLVKQKLIYKLRSSIIKEIKLHKEKNAQIVILSAALPYICEPLAKYLQLDDVICSRMETIKNIFTGKPLGQICIGQEKEIRARQYCIEKNYKFEKAYSYGDSYSDRFILKLTGKPVCVAPDKKLRKLSTKMNWKIID